MLVPFMRERLFTALAGAPDVIDGLLGSLSATDPRWDARPDAERFTLREIIAHLNDYEAIWLERIQQTQAQSNPTFQMVDRDQLAIDNDYAHCDVAATRRLLQERRLALVAYLITLTEDDWTRTAQMAGGSLSLEEQALFVVVHDGYHTCQIAQWMR